MGEADRDWSPLENTQPSPIWTSLPGAKLSSAEKATDVNSSSLLLLTCSIPPWGRELRPSIGSKWRIPVLAVRNVTLREAKSKSFLTRDLRWACRGIWGLKSLCGILGWVVTLAFSWQQIHPFCFSLGTSFSRSGSVPSEKKKLISQLLKDSWEHLWEILVSFILSLKTKPGLPLAFEPRPWNLGQWEWRELSWVFLVKNIFA